MTESEALVIGLADDFAVVEVAALPSACGKCGERGGCGKPQAAPRRYVVRNVIGARPGDRVVVAVPDGAVLKAAALSYLMPLLLVIGGAAAATAWAGEGLPAVAGAAGGLAAGLAILRMTNARLTHGREPSFALTLQRTVINTEKESRACSNDTSSLSR